MAETWNYLATWLIDFYFLSAILLGLVAVGTWFLRQPSQRLVLCWGAVLGLFLLAIAAAVPMWPKTSIPLLASLSSTELALGDGNGAAPVRIESLSNSDPSSSVAPASTAHTELGATPRDQAKPISAETLGTPSLGIGPHSLSDLASFACQSILVAGAAIISCWLLLGALLAARLRRRAVLAPEKVQVVMTRLLQDPRPIPRVFVSEQVSQALAVGLLTPRILLPARFLTDETSESLRSVLLHEATHIRNGDLWLLAALRFWMLILFAHPLYWWLRGQTRLDQELLADAAAGREEDAAEYAELLLEWFKSNQSDRHRLATATLGLWERPHQLKRRIAMLLDTEFQVERNSSAGYRMGFGAALGFLLLGLSLVTLRDVKSATAKESASTVVAKQMKASLPPTPSPREGQDLKPAIPQRAKQDTRKPEPPPSEAIQSPKANVLKENLAPKAETPAAAPPKAAYLLAQNPVEVKFKDYRSAMSVAAGFYNSGSLKAAKAPLEAAVELANTDYEKLKAHDALISVYAEAGDYDKMYASAEFSVEHTAHHASKGGVCRKLYYHVHKKGQVDQAEERYRKQLEADPNDSMALYMLSQYYYRLSRNHKKRAELLERLYSLDKTNADTAVDLAFSYSLSAQYDKAADLYQHLSETHEEGKAWNIKELAKNRAAAGDLQKAKQAALHAHQLGPGKRAQLSLESWYADLGDVFLKVGAKEHAVEYIEKAAELTITDFRRKQYAEKLQQAKDL